MMNELFLEPVILIPCMTVLGLLVGSFLNVVIHRIPIMMENAFRHECACLDLPEDAPPPPAAEYNLVYPRSACPHCGKPIGAFDNIPVISWLLLKGKCKHCQAPISLRYPMVEALCAVLSGLIAWQYGSTSLMLAYTLFAWITIALVFIDADTGLLPDSLTLPLLWLGLLFNLYTGQILLADAVLGAVAGYLSLWSVYHLYKFLTKKEGMGYGDFKLLAALGAWLGWEMIPFIILASSCVGAVLGIIMIILARRGFNKQIPFGPYLGIAGFIAMHWGQQIMTWWYGVV